MLEQFVLNKYTGLEKPGEWATVLATGVHTLDLAVISQKNLSPTANVHLQPVVSQKSVTNAS